MPEPLPDAPTWRRCLPEIGLFLFIALNAVAMVATDVGQTVPFHFIWISLTLAYGYRTWQARWTLTALLAVCAVTTASLVIAVSDDGLDPAELTEVPLMAAVFLANIMHARRRETALGQVRQLAAEQERQRVKERDFLRDASHLLRTPVTIARGYTELLRASLDDAEHAADTDIILRELDSMTRISNRLLLLTSTQLDDLLDASRGDVADLLQQAVLRWQPAAPRTWQVRTEPCEVVGDLGLLESALDALIENAVRHTEDGGTITLRCSRHGDDVLVDVADDGAGIPPEQLAGLFERKWRPRTPGERTGSGLGLAIVKAIVVAHGGDVRAAGARLGGAEFTLRLPAAVRSSTAEPTAHVQRRRSVLPEAAAR
jgi:signal transduction histidine kinase